MVHQECTEPQQHTYANIGEIATLRKDLNDFRLHTFVHLDALLIDTLFVQGLLKVLLCRDRAQLALFVVHLHVEVERFEVLELFCRDFVCYGYFPEDLATFIESEHVIQIHWTLWDPIHAKDRENIQTDTENFKVKDIAHVLEIGDNKDLVDYIEHDES
jgi:hypothetical protein